MHDRDYLGLIRETAGRATALDPDTFTSPDTYDVARLAAGAVLAGVDHVLERGTRSAGAGDGPSARPSRGAQPRDGLLPVQQRRDRARRTRARRVWRGSRSSTTTSTTATARSGRSTTTRRCCSSRRTSSPSTQAPARPVTSGRARGVGFTVNFPLEAGATDADFERIYGVAGRHSSEVSTGADPPVRRVRRARGRSARRHAGDDTAQFGRLTALVAAAADECCEGRLVAVTEGGYDLAALAGSLRGGDRRARRLDRARGSARAGGRHTPRRGCARRRAPASAPSSGRYNRASLEYRPQDLDKKWQQRWTSSRAFEVDVDPSRPKFYCLEMFAYPSGHAHVGHVRNYSIGDVLARMKRMRGYNVLHPFGWDAFGLPAENAAIKGGIHPEVSTRSNIAHMKGQLQRLGISYAWEREFATCDPDTTSGTSGCSSGCSSAAWPTAAARRSTGARSTTPCSPTSRWWTAAAGAAARRSRRATSSSGSSRSPPTPTSCSTPPAALVAAGPKRC